MVFRWWPLQDSVLWIPGFWLGDVMEEIPYYVYDDEEKSHIMSENGEAYIDDGDLRELLLDLLGDNINENYC